MYLGRCREELDRAVMGRKRNKGQVRRAKQSSSIEHDNKEQCQQQERQEREQCEQKQHLMSLVLNNAAKGQTECKPECKHGCPPPTVSICHSAEEANLNASMAEHMPQRHE